MEQREYKDLLHCHMVEKKTESEKRRNFPKKSFFSLGNSRIENKLFLLVKKKKTQSKKKTKHFEVKPLKMVREKKDRDREQNCNFLLK